MTSPSKGTRPTITLCMIVKNEKKNLPRLLESVKECFDEIHITDTGSDDGTAEWLLSEGEAVAKCPVYVHHFKWVNDFAAARNYSFSHAKTDYLLWLDGDDSLKNREGFIKWRDHAMEFSEAWFATYNYALDANGNSIVSFVRERVFKKALNPTWKYPLHEGIIAKPEWAKDYAIAWQVDHHRDAQDVAQDKSRNIKILEEMRSKGNLDARMQFYYGKELYECGRPQESVLVFEDAISRPDIEHHDKILALQYGAYASIQCADQLKDEHRIEKDRYFNKALDFAHKGIQMDPNRAEFHTTCGDVKLKRMDLLNAIPYYAAAKNCINQKSMGSPYEGAIYSFVDCYGINPSLNLAKIYFNIGKVEEAKKEALECVEKYNSQEAKDILAEMDKFKALTNLDNGQVETEDIVFVCPPQNVYEFDEDLYEVKGMGGSETALIEMARNLKKLTGRPVKVFNQRSNDLMAKSGVEYISNAKLNEYLSKNKPKVCINWRHNIRTSRAKTYAWIHDLVLMGAESGLNADKAICLSQFHKDYVNAKQNVPAEKIWLSRNGLNTEKFNFPRKPKNPNKLVWMSSPDRGLINCIPMLDKVREKFPNITLDIYYGFENLYKYGPAMSALADKLKAMIAERPWINYRGFTEQSKMYREINDAVCWPHCATFIESFCITALEMLELGIFPVTRRLGALKNTLADAESKGNAIILEHDCVTEDQRQEWANAVCRVLEEKQWERMSFDKEKHSWEQIAKEWVEEMKLA